MHSYIIPSDEPLNGRYAANPSQLSLDSAMRAHSEIAEQSTWQSVINTQDIELRS